MASIASVRLCGAMLVAMPTAMPWLPLTSRLGEARRQCHGLGERFVVVGLPVDGILLQVTQQFHGGLGQAALGVTHGRRAVAIDVAEVAVNRR